MDTLFQNFQPFPFCEEKDHFLSIDGFFTKLGLWTEGEFRWIDPSAQTENWEDHPLTIECQTFDASINYCKVLYVKMKVSNQSEHSKAFKMYFQQEIQCRKGEDIVYYAPNQQVMVHHSGDSSFLCNGKYKEAGIKQYSMESRERSFTPHLFKDLQKGTLCFQPFSVKNVRSAFTLEGDLEPYDTENLYYWLIKGQHSQHTNMLNQFLQKNTLEFR